jgi:hypothetical protein
MTFVGLSSISGDRKKVEEMGLAKIAPIGAAVLALGFAAMPEAESAPVTFQAQGTFGSGAVLGGTITVASERSEP